MSAFYDRLAATSAALLARFGQAVVLRRAAAGTYDPATGGVTASAPTDVTRKGAPFDFNAGIKEVKGALIQAGDKQLLLEPGVVPTTADKIVFGGAAWEILSVEELSPGGTVVLYTLHLRK